MNSIEYYKSLVSDEEVIKALIKESKTREGELFKEKTRIRPNLNFFQRTVTNLVSSNKRITTKQEDISKERLRYVRKVRTPHMLMKEILLANKRNFGTPEDKNTHSETNCFPNSTEGKQGSSGLKQKCNKSDNLLKTSGKRQSINFNLNLDKSKFVVKASTSICEDVSQSEKHKQSSSTDSSNINIISVFSSESSSTVSSPDIIKISDSDSDISEEKSLNKDHINSTRVCKHRDKRKLKKKRKRRKDVI